MLLRTFLTLAALILPFYSDACSRVFWQNSINTATARTMDLYVDDHPSFAVLPRGMQKQGDAGKDSIQWTSKYGSVVITAFGKKAISEGMNEKGLSGHLLYLHETDYEASDSRPALSNVLWVEYILDNCATVVEALEALKGVRIVSREVEGREWPIHASVEDASGDSAIIEFVNKKMVIHHGQQYTVMTNEPAYNIQIQNLARYKYFGGPLPLPGDIDSMSRFVRCSAFLKTLPAPASLIESVGSLLSVIRSSQVPFGAEDTSTTISVDTWPTRWASVTDVSQLVYYFNSTSSPNMCWVDFKGLDFGRIKTEKSIPLQNPALVGDITADLLK